MHEFQQLVFEHYNQNRRDFPWRQTTDPYAITVSEIMLQQTQTERVVPKYEAFLIKLPTWKALASVSTTELLQLWQGLGYNRRALALKRMAEKVVNEYGGKLPHTYQELLNFPGIGPYTAGAISAFAFNTGVPLIETNIRRAYIHHFFADKEGVHDKELLPLIEQTMDVQNPREWYYALMDYGAWLAKQLPNPNRRSKHYTKQGKFEGSNRQIRGRILRILSHTPHIKYEELIQSTEDSPARVGPIITQLAQEGFLICDGEEVRVA